MGKLLCTLLLVGCINQPAPLDLEARWLPLKQVVQGDLPFVPDDAITTIVDTCYVVDLDAFQASHPEPRFTAIMLHERAHARRQNAAWFVRYLMEPSFAWAEEQIGWRLELLWLRDHGVSWSPEGIARMLSRYQVVGGSMVSFEDALAWAKAVLKEPVLSRVEGP